MTRYSCNTSLLDVLFNMLLAFAMLFIIAFALVRKDTPQKEADIKIEGDLLVTITWPSERDDDIDLWVRDPNGNIVFFSDRQAGLMYLDRDDVGFTNDTIAMPDGSLQRSIGNQEMVTVRGLQAGEFVFNVHAFRLREPRPIPVSIRIMRIGAPTETILVKTVTLQRTGDERTVIRLTFDKDGNVVDSSEVFTTLFNKRDPNDYQGGRPDGYGPAGTGGN